MRANSIIFVLLPAALVNAAEPGDRPGRALRRTPVVEAYERARTAVVNISATDKVRRLGVDLWGEVFMMPQENSVGSGFVIHPDGYIATNAHVVSAGSQLKVTFADGNEYEAQIIGRDTTRDLAVIKIEPRQPLAPIVLGRSDDLMIGEQTIAVGNPVGLQNTVTAGIISALHRELQVGNRVVYRDVIQTDASINPGNSGGPLLNALGELIGVNTAIRSDAQNIGFAIPVDQLREMLPEILDGEKLNKVQIGLRVDGMDPPRVVHVREGSPAAKAGVISGDVITEIDGRPVPRSVDLQIALLERKAGEELNLKLLRDGHATDARLPLVPLPKPDGKKLAVERLGVTVADVKENAAKRFQWGRQGGVIVMAVEPRSPAAEAGLAPGDLLVSFGRYWLTDISQMSALLAEVEQGTAVDVGFRRAVQGRLLEGETRLYIR
ncbi:MAG: trypsin-like peptidase domain-containing protein [Planctomycetes bacterium]|nr:trypsin-like peptidase domain-containing protein [Planctomycetota bacterium]